MITPDIFRYGKQGIAVRAGMVLSFFSVADIRGFLQEDDGGGDGFGNVSYPFQRTDNEEKVDVEGRGVLPFGGDQKGQRFAMGFVQFLSRRRISLAASTSCVSRHLAASLNSDTAISSRGSTISGERDS